MKNNMSNRKIYLDVIRILACVMVVLMHSPMEGASGALQNAINALTSPCIGLFFMVSGALLLPCEGGWGFVRKRFSKVLVPTLVWTAFYIAANIFIKHQDPSLLPKQILSLPFSPQGHGILWFMYTLCGLYLLAPIISPWLKSASKKDMKILLLIWGITLLFPLLDPWLQISKTTSAPLYYFTGYAGYFILGYYFSRHGISISIGKAAILALLVLACWGAVRFFPTGIKFEEAISYLSLPTVVLTVVYFCVFEKIGKKIRSDSALARTLEVLSGLSFGVYLLHIFFIRYILWGRMPGGAVQIAVTAAVTLVACFAVCWVISKISFSPYLIGYSSRKKK